MTELEVALKIALANMFVTYYKAHTYHWNVECENFSEMHKFFRKLYESFHGHVDELAEQLRMIEVYAPMNVSELIKTATILEDGRVPTTYLNMIQSLVDALNENLASLDKTFQLAENNNNQGLMSFISDLMNKLAFQKWQLTSFLK